MWVGLRYCFADYKAVCEGPPLKWCVVDLLPLSWREPCKIGFDSPFTDSSPHPHPPSSPSLIMNWLIPPPPLVTLRKEGLGMTLIESSLIISLLAHNKHYHSFCCSSFLSYSSADRWGCVCGQGKESGSSPWRKRCQGEKIQRTCIFQWHLIICTMFSSNYCSLSFLMRKYSQADVKAKNKRERKVCYLHTSTSF